jgi:hypothetical protein
MLDSRWYAVVLARDYSHLATDASRIRFDRNVQQILDFKPIG